MQRIFHVRGTPLGLLVHPIFAVFAAICFFSFIRYMDSRWAYMPYIFSVTLAIATLVFLVSRRAYFSLYAGGTISALQALASSVKFRLNGMALHVYDIIYSAGDNALIAFLIEFYPAVLAASLVTMLAALVFLTLVFLLDRPLPFGLLLRAALVPLALVSCFTAFPRAKTHDSEYLPFTAGYNASALYFSFSHVPYLLGGAPILTRLAGVKAQKPFADTVECGPPERKSDIHLVLAESQAVPTMFPDIAISRDVEAQFTSGDGKLRPFYVETFGAGTWMTSFSVLTGMSTAELGWQAPYVNKFMEGKVRGSLPEILSRCGYRTVAVMSLKYHSINEGPFLKALGFEEIHDADRTALGIYGVRDSAYYDYADKLIAAHRKTDKRPLFLYMQTMFPHSPYLVPLVPESEMPFETFSPDREVTEYLRRLLASRKDFAAFLERRRADPGPRGTLIAEFGDHQATATRSFLDINNFGSAETTDFGSKMYETFYSVHAFGSALDYTKLSSGVDAALMMADVLSATDLPTSPVFTDLARLSDLCEGRMHLCRQRNEVEIHLKRRIDAKLLAFD